MKKCSLFITHHFLFKIAAIMELKGCKSGKYPRLIIVRRENGSGGDIEQVVDKINRCLCSNSSLPLVGWKAQDLRTIQFLLHPDVPDIICDIGAEGNEQIEIIKMQELLTIIYERAIIQGGKNP